MCITLTRCETSNITYRLKARLLNSTYPSTFYHVNTTVGARLILKTENWNTEEICLDKNTVFALRMAGFTIRITEFVDFANRQLFLKD
jgi:hypothetical protein